MFLPLERVRTQRDADQGGTFRWYHDDCLPERLGAGIVTIRLHGNDEDRQRTFDRAETVRRIPPGDPAFETLCRRRNDADRINRHPDDMLMFVAGSFGRRPTSAVEPDHDRCELDLDARPSPGPRPTARRLSAEPPKEEKRGFGAPRTRSNTPTAPVGCRREPPSP